MSTTFFEPGGAPYGAAFVSRWVKRACMPLEAWSSHRRWLVATAIAALVFAFGAYGWNTADLAGLEASRAALALGTQRLAQARHALAQLPSLRRAAAAMPATVSSAVPWNPPTTCASSPSWPRRAASCCSRSNRARRAARASSASASCSSPRARTSSS
ncbi:hypothetical protein HDG41_006147 [Paraburkholderia sp. JPY162]|uniref:Uncharacterized protein n=1 Tax=Paraburkholderia youngii TaxID=2782701 RepID=A0A7W8P574_9BURK|nr:hypothetical protein [Paraburkholderia youngii]